MIISEDYLMIIRGVSINPAKKILAKKAYSKFITELQELFSSEEMSNLIDLDVMIQGMRLKQRKLSLLYDGLKMVYDLRDTKEGKIKALDSLKQVYRSIYFDYPKSIESKTHEEEMQMTASEYKIYAEDQQKQIDSILKPIENEIKRLGYKIEERQPKQKEAVAQDDRNTGLDAVIHFIEAVEKNGYFDRSKSVSSLKFDYDMAIKKQQKLKAR
jgi:hypothetical protein